MKYLEEMRLKGNSLPMALFKIYRTKLLGGPLLLNKGWDWHWKSKLEKQGQIIKERRISEAIWRQLRRNLGYYSDCAGQIGVKNGRWFVKGDKGKTDLSELLK